MSKSIYERVLNLRNRISLDGDDTIYEEDYLLLDEVLDYIIVNKQRAQEETYNYTVGLYKELEAGATIKKQEKLLELYKELNNKHKDLITLARHNTWSWKLDIEINEIQDKIKELENEQIQSLV